MLIGLAALALMLCISPVAAVSGSDFEIVHDCYYVYGTYKYYNTVDPDEKYIHIFTEGTNWLKSYVSFKPANIPDAPVMMVNTDGIRSIKLPRCVDDWEIKYYSRFCGLMPFHPTEKYLKNKGIVNLNEFFKDNIEKVIHLELSVWQYLVYTGDLEHYWVIPDVD
jgi:hypothetical protein